MTSILENQKKQIQSDNKITSKQKQITSKHSTSKHECLISTISRKCNEKYLQNHKATELKTRAVPFRLLTLQSPHRKRETMRTRSTAKHNLTSPSPRSISIHRQYHAPLRWPRVSKFSHKEEGGSLAYLEQRHRQIREIAYR